MLDPLLDQAIDASFTNQMSKIMDVLVDVLVQIEDGIDQRSEVEAAQFALTGIHYALRARDLLRRACTTIQVEGGSADCIPERDRSFGE